MRPVTPRAAATTGMSWWIKIHPLLLAILLITGVLPARGNDVFPATNALILPSTDKRFIVDDEAFEKESGNQVERLAKEGRLTDYSYLAKHVPLVRPSLILPTAATNQLTTPELADLLRHSTVAIGLRYQEPHTRNSSGTQAAKVGKWHYEIAATAFAIAPEIFSTSLHVMTIDPTMMRDAQAVAVTEEGKVFPITQIVASSERGDTCLVRVPGLTLPSLPLRPGVRTGEPIWCMSHPDGFTFMFTSGQVARISRERYDKQSAPGLHIEVTAEYCPGSSGGAVTDASGNVVAQVSSINQYSDSGSLESKNTQIASGIVSARTCTASEEIINLTTPGTNDPLPLPTPSPKKKRHLPKTQATPTSQKSEIKD
ncbi:MAG: serine protease [bacterium]